MNDKPHVMVVDDDLAMCSFLRTFLGSRGYSALTVTSGEEAVLRFHAERPAAVILDVVMPGNMDGLAALEALKKIDRDVPVIVLSGKGGTNTVVQAMKLGATDFVSKPFDETDLEVPLANALKQRQLTREVATLREQLQSQSHYNMLFGNSERMAEVQDLIDRVADTDVTVLIRGESGTGKELVARALSASSLRRDKRFVKVNCAALPTELLESELFGFERGAFTGAIQHKPGKIEFANHGTMFLDEIGDMSSPLQRGADSQGNQPRHRDGRASRASWQSPVGGQQSTGDHRRSSVRRARQRIGRFGRRRRAAARAADAGRNRERGRRRRQLLAQGHFPGSRPPGRARADLQDASADALEPQGDR